MLKRVGTQQSLDAMFRQLAAKYAVEVPESWRLEDVAPAASEGSLMLAAGWMRVDTETPEGFLPLLPWRSERRFVELKRLVDTRTLESVVMCRFSCLSTGTPMGLKAILYREFDLIEWLTGSPIVSVCASMSAGRFANVLVRLENGVVGSVEVGTTLPAEAKPALLDRHELIARRGVASDRVVDTQVPQSSVYTFTERGLEQYTDTDAELYGLEGDEVNLVRAAYELATRPELAEGLRSQHLRLVGLVQLAFESERTRQRLAVKGGCSCNR